MTYLFLGNFGAAEIFFLLFIFLLPLVLFIVAIFDLIQRQFNDSTNKIIWALLILFVPFLGSILYLLARKKDGVRK